ncbi:hypothetical protein NLI96_g713 [Meripilus lineatus]|uniref:Uncharacterized protein n=1 Tax=Meripilus lineatus TaxID=2056292 RepID=A0AAD5VD98_9APHY|nr:hypothetical protein NLI96_g5696 [Physisporinus lineatus]KAJ3491447.1 hypothetical protein NLI96_g713 [Physisporinus lineatus]
MASEDNLLHLTYAAESHPSPSRRAAIEARDNISKLYGEDGVLNTQTTDTQYFGPNQPEQPKELNKAKDKPADGDSDEEVEYVSGPVNRFEKTIAELRIANNWLVNENDNLQDALAISRDEAAMLRNQLGQSLKERDFKDRYILRLDNALAHHKLPLPGIKSESESDIEPKPYLKPDPEASGCQRTGVFRVNRE